MKAAIKKSDLLPVLSKVQGLTGRRTNLAITTNVLVKTNKNGISVSATDLETGFEGFYEAKVEAEGIIAINARKFYEIVRDFPSEDIFLNEVENHWIEIGNQNVEYHIVGLNPDDFPEIPKRLKSQLLSAVQPMINVRTLSVFLLNGLRKKRIRFFGLSQLTAADFQRWIILPPGENVMIPKKGLVEVSKFLDSEGPAKIGFKDNNFIVQKERETWIIRLLEGDFPEYGDIIVKKGGSAIPMDRHLFLMMLKRMSIISSEDYKGVIFNFEKNRLMITSTNPDIGESKEDMDVEYKGDAITVMFNPKYFIETLNVIEDDKVILNITDEEKPCLIEGEKDKTYLSVIMPMRI
jgi:DNA polymerase-3 subunit beta